MMTGRFHLPRESYIPSGAVKIADKLSDAVVYLYTSGGRICAAGFHGKQAKPDWRLSFKDEAQRERRVRQWFDARQQTKTMKSEIAEKRNRPHNLQVGHILNTCWGYDQTNREFFQVTKIIGPHTVELREIAQMREDTGWCQGKATPQIDSFISEPIRRRARAGGTVRIDNVRLASLWEMRPVSFSTYA